MNQKILPSGFEDLEGFAQWALPSERERIRKRYGTEIEEIKRFYVAMLARAPAVLEHLDKFELGAYPEQELRLLYMMFSLTEAASAVESYNQPSVILGFDKERLVPKYEMRISGATWA